MSFGHFLVRPAQLKDVTGIVRVHMESFAGFFLTFLGPSFLALLYRSISGDPKGIVLVTEVEGRIVGFVAGVTQQTGFYLRLVQEHKWAFARAALGAVIRRPTIVARLWRALRRPSGSKESAADACLMSIAVLPELQGQGVGALLVESFCKVLVERGERAVCLTTDRDHNEATNRFYQNLDFRLARTFVTPEGRPMNEYVRILQEA